MSLYSMGDPGTSLRIEITFGTFNPLQSGGTLPVNIRAIAPDGWYYQGGYQSQSFAYVQAQCTWGLISFSTSTSGNNFKDTGGTFQFSDGSWNLYPLDKYKGSGTIRCVSYYYDQFDNVTQGRYFAENPTATSKYLAGDDLSFNLAADSSYMGLFAPRYSAKQAIAATYGPYNEGFINISFVATSVYPVFEIALERAVINIVFPMYLLIAMWMIVIAQTLIFLPFFWDIKKVIPHSLDNFE